MFNNGFDSNKIHIPIRIINGEIKYFYGGDLPDIDDIAIGELVIPEYSVKDRKFLDTISKVKNTENTVKVQNDTLMIAVDSRNIPDDKRDYCNDIMTFPLAAGVFVEVKLLEPLKFRLNSSNKAYLLSTKCLIPSLDNTTALSLNHAYTSISQVFEPFRISHTGNVFEKCFFQSGDKWYPLDDLREDIQASSEGDLFLDYKVFSLIRKPEDKDKITAVEAPLIEYLLINTTANGERIKTIYNNEMAKYLMVVNNLLDKRIIQEAK